MTSLASLRRRGAVALAALLALAALTACTGSSSGSGFTYSSATSIGKLIPVADRKPAENVGGSLLDGGTTTLAADKGKVVIINFWATWCGPCQVETPQFDSLYRQVKSQGVQVIGVNTKDQKSKAQAFVKDNGISFPVVFDEDGSVLLKLGNIPSAGLPITVLVDKSQRVAAVYVTRLATKQLEPAIAALRAET